MRVGSGRRFEACLLSEQVSDQLPFYTNLVPIQYHLAPVESLSPMAILPPSQDIFDSADRLTFCL